MEDNTTIPKIVFVADENNIITKIKASGFHQEEKASWWNRLLTNICSPTKTARNRFRCVN